MNIVYHIKMKCAKCGEVLEYEDLVEFYCEKCSTWNTPGTEHVVEIDIYVEEINNQFIVYDIDHEEKKAFIDPNPGMASYGGPTNENSIDQALKDAIRELKEHDVWKDYNFIVRKR